MPARRITVHLLLALAMLCAQLALAVHLLSHGASVVNGEDDPGTPGHRVACLLCVAGAHSGDAVPTFVPTLHLATVPVFERAQLFWSYLPPVALAFSSRAPPAFL